MPVTRKDLHGMYKPYLVEAIRLESEVQSLLDQWADINDEIVKRHTSSTGIKNIQKLTKELLETVTEFLKQYGIIMDIGMAKISDVKAQQVLEESLPLLRAVGDTTGIEYFKKDMQAFSGVIATRWAAIGVGIYGITFLQRQAALELSTKKTVNNIITLANREKLGGQEIQAILRDYVNPNNVAEKPFDIARKALDASKKYVPKDVLAGSVQTNMYEIARNQSSDIWRQLTEEAYDNAEWVDGYDWILSGSHPKVDICDDLADESPYPKKSKRPYSHGHCMCDWAAHMRPISELKDILKDKGVLYNSKYVK